MSKTIANAVKLLINKRVRDLDYLEISWFGGEPLLATDVVLDVANYANHMAATTKTDYRGTITTNAYLLNMSRFSELLSAGISEFQITLDGPSSSHDTRRKLAGGGPTFDTIWANLIAMKGATGHFRVILRVHFDGQSYLNLPPLVDELRSSFVPDERFDVVFHPLGRLGGANDEEIAILPVAEERLVIDQLYAQLGQRATMPTGVNSSVCYAARANSLVIRADGRLAKCTVALNDPRNTVGRLQDDGTVTVDSGRLAPWLRGIVTLDEAVLACPLMGL